MAIERAIFIGVGPTKKAANANAAMKALAYFEIPGPINQKRPRIRHRKKNYPAEEPKQKRKKKDEDSEEDDSLEEESEEEPRRNVPAPEKVIWSKSWKRSSGNSEYLQARLDRYRND